MSPGVSTSSSASADIGSVNLRTKGWAGASGGRSERAAVRWGLRSWMTGTAETPNAARVALSQLT